MKKTDKETSCEKTEEGQETSCDKNRGKTGNIM